MEALRPTTQPTTQPSDQDASLQEGGPNARFQLWTDYLAALQRGAELVESAEATASEERIGELSGNIQELQAKTTALADSPVPSTVTDQRWEEITTLHEDTTAQVDSLSETQSGRAAWWAKDLREQTQLFGRAAAVEVRVQRLDHPLAHQPLDVLVRRRFLLLRDERGGSGATQRHPKQDTDLHLPRDHFASTRLPVKVGSRRPG